MQQTVQRLYTIWFATAFLSLATCRPANTRNDQAGGRSGSSGGKVGSGGQGSGGAGQGGAAGGSSTASSSQAGSGGHSSTASGGQVSSGGRSSSAGADSGGASGGASESLGGGGGTTGSQASGQAGNTGTGACSEGLTIKGLKVEANTKSVLSAFVIWSTDTPADSVVQFGESKYEWEIFDPAPVTSHKVLVIGMRASKTYRIKALSSVGGCTGNATDTFKTDALPSQIPVGTVDINDTTKSQPGWTLMNVIKSSSSMGPIGDSPAAAVMYDDSGQPVWYYINGTTKDYGGATSTYLTDKGVLVGPVNGQSGPGESPREVDFAGNTIWECRDALCGGSGGLTHDTIKLANGNYVVNRWRSLSGASTDSDPTFEEIDATGKVVWSLSFSKLVPKPSSSSGDWCHGNSISIDIAKDAVYANCRFMGLIKTSYKNPNSLIWYLPASYGKATGSLTFSPTTSQYSDTHDPEVHDDGTILFFDNGGYSASMMPGGSTTRYHSRVVEYKIDEAQKTATLSWEFPGTFAVDTWYKDTWYNAYFGDADRMPNGNVLIAAGSIGSKLGDCRVFEATKNDGKVVWELKMPSGIGVYRADRITPPLVHPVVTEKTSP